MSLSQFIRSSTVVNVCASRKAKPVDLAQFIFRKGVYILVSMYLLVITPPTTIADSVKLCKIALLQV